MPDFMNTYLERIAAKDFAGAGEFYADDMVAHQSGRHQWSGDYQGKDAFLAMLGDMTGSFDSLDISHHAHMEGEGHNAVLNSITVTRGGKSFSGNRVVVYHTSDDKITELWIVDQDQAALEEFLA